MVIRAKIKHLSVQQAGGLPLTVGEHVVKILSDGCKPDVHRVTVKKTSEAARSIMSVAS